MKVAVGQKLNLASMLELATCTSSKAAPLNTQVEPALEKIDADMTVVQI